MAVACELCGSAKLDWDDLDLYRFFAFALGSPSQERFDILARPGLKNALTELWQQLGCRGEDPNFVWFADYEEYEATYIALFDVGIPEPPVPLFESAHNKSKPAQEIALENTLFYEALGLKWDSSCAVPDYLITQLEFLAAVHYTLEHAEDTTSGNLARLETDFLDRHALNWVPSASAKLARVAPCNFGPLMTMLATFLQNRREEVNKIGRESANLPVDQVMLPPL
ncbi:MAG TPA: molecular chaperone TorD family protein [Terriglobales bacterium]|nr:molecular chaperone TorD family protein [Terriglobales bacterium]